MARGQLIGLQHALAARDGEPAIVEGGLKDLLRGLARRPGMILLDEHVVVDVGNGERAAAADATEELEHVLPCCIRVPAFRFEGVLLHVGDEEAEIGDRNIAQRMGPIFEHGLRLRLGEGEIAAPVGGDAVEQDVVVAALDDVDGVDLHVTEMGDSARHRLRPGAEGRGRVQPLRVDPDARGRGPARFRRVPARTRRRGLGFDGGTGDWPRLTWRRGLKSPAILPNVAGQHHPWRRLPPIYAGITPPCFAARAHHHNLRRTRYRLEPAQEQAS